MLCGAELSDDGSIAAADCDDDHHDGWIGGLVDLVVVAAAVAVAVVAVVVVAVVDAVEQTQEHHQRVQPLAAPLPGD